MVLVHIIMAYLYRFISMVSLLSPATGGVNGYGNGFALPAPVKRDTLAPSTLPTPTTGGAVATGGGARIVTVAELAIHNSVKDCWYASYFLHFDPCSCHYILMICSINGTGVQ
jgi:hypothetical protein